MLKFEVFSGRAGAAVFAAMVLAACGSTGPSGSSQASPTPSEPQLVIADLVDPTAVNFTAAEVRLVKLDGTVIASAKGRYDVIVGDSVIVVDGNSLKALDRNGSAKQLGKLAAVPSGLGERSVVLKPDLTQWIYAIADPDWTAHIHLGTSSTDRVIATLPSPDGNATYRPFAWNASGIYLIRQETGLGGAGPFLEYHERLARFDLTTGLVSDISPDCRVYEVLDDDTMICRQLNPQGRIDVRTPSGQDNVIQVSSGVVGQAYDTGAYIRVVVSPDGNRLMAGRNGSTDPMINYQIAVADLTSSSAKAFGPLDYLPDAWLPDGRIVADHWCAAGFGNTGVCDASLDGTYVFSADGASHSLLFKLTQGAAVVGYV
jgi:hypothetical protein